MFPYSIRNAMNNMHFRPQTVQGLQHDATPQDPLMVATTAFTSEMEFFADAFNDILFDAVADTLMHADALLLVQSMDAIEVDQVRPSVASVLAILEDNAGVEQIHADHLIEVLHSTELVISSWHSQCTAAVTHSFREQVATSQIGASSLFERRVPEESVTEAINPPLQQLILQHLMSHFEVLA